MSIIKGKCGTDCSACRFKEKFACQGCNKQCGAIFWGECQVYHCAAGKGYAHCGKCPLIPCSMLLEMIENGHNPDRLSNLQQWKNDEA